MNAEKFIKIINADFFTGVPDSQLRALCDCLMNTYGIDPSHHVIAANEGNCVALAAGYYLSSGKIPAVYMQNSGEGNIINPVVSLANKKVYSIPMIFIIGWRGEPGVHDEPQHIFQGEITTKLLDDIGIDWFAVGTETSEEELAEVMRNYSEILARGGNVAFIIRKGALSYDKKYTYSNKHSLMREDVIRSVASVSGEDIIVSTTGKASRELYEIRTLKNQSHKYDFLTVGSMGHSSSIALGIAQGKPNTKVWCIDGDGAALMHMGSLAVIAKSCPSNLIHIIINNGAHETVGGMPTAADNFSFAAVAAACGYPYTVRIENVSDLNRELKSAKARKSLSLLEIMCSIGSRADLGRPTTSPLENKNEFMSYLKTLD